MSNSKAQLLYTEVNTPESMSYDYGVIILGLHEMMVNELHLRWNCRETKSGAETAGATQWQYTSLNEEIVDPTKMSSVYIARANQRREIQK